ncbi:MAG TPA: TonB-dependent receptor [Wenzhouxiangellaceae bacterium]|nr:TonB-dependent receptor [Wenzhouxiangellaceae bacterium]
MRHTAISRSVSLALASGWLFSTTVAAQQAEPEVVELEAMEVKVLPQGGTTLDSTRPVQLLSGEYLDDRKEATLGETLQAEPGIHSTYFGPGAGRPIIRGLGGSRVRITEDGLNSLDASALSPDHAVSAEPLLIDRIEILRGPANLLYGSTASGGVVNLIDNRIPEQRQAFGGAVELRAGTVADELAGVARIDGGFEAFQFHFDGFKRDTNDYEIPGFALSPELLAELDPEERTEQVRGRLENSAQESEGGSVGFSLVGDWGFAGVAYKRFDTDYGIPGAGHAHEEEHGDDGDDDHDDDHGDEHEGEEEESVSIGLEQERYEFKAGLYQPVSGIEELNFKLVTNDYQHIEFEGDEVGTTFNIEATEWRAEARHQQFGRLSGVVGVQYEDNDLEAIGDEAFVPPANTESLGIFLVEEYDLDPVRLSAGLRYQNDEVKLADGLAVDGISSRDFSAFSVSAGTLWRVTDDWQASLNWQRSQRSPTQEELFANGRHIATQAFEIGDPTLGKETSNNIDFGIHKHSGRFHVRLDLFYNNIDDFVYLANTGDVEDDLPVQVWSQADANFWGAEFEASMLFEGTAVGDLEWRLFADSVEADLKAGNGEVPRLSPGRIGTGLDWHRGNLRANVNYHRVFEVDEVAEFETRTGGYDSLSANLAYRLMVDSSEIELFLKGDNLLDQTQRVHTSFLKEFAPRPGLNVTGGVRVRF